MKASLSMILSLYCRKSVISINEMLLAMKRIKKIPDDVRFQKIVQVLDEDRDGRIELVHAMKVRILKILQWNSIFPAIFTMVTGIESKKDLVFMQLYLIFYFD